MVGSGAFLSILKVDVAVLAVSRGPVGFAAPWRFKILDSQPVQSDMGLVPTHFHDFRDFQKSGRGFLARYLPCFETFRWNIAFSSFPVGTKKNREKSTQICGGITSRSA